MSHEIAESEILFEKRDALGHVTLSRPKALNALTQGMADQLFQQLKLWGADDAIRAVLVRGAGGKAFCAGGDVIRLYNDGRTGGPYPKSFYWSEYRCNALIKAFKKPYIAVMDGIVMGGGVGIAIHGSHRIATEKTLFAMPETGIGLFPDVGGTYFLPRLPDWMGLYLGLTGRRLNGADCVAVGLVDAYVPSARIDTLEEKLAAGVAASAAINDVSTSPPDAPLLAERDLINRHFSSATVEEILQSLAQDGGEWAVKTIGILNQKAPLSLKVTERQLQLGTNLSFADAMRLEWRLASRFAADHDFYEGVRALLVDKDMTPHWRPATLADVQAQSIDAYFAPLPSGELDLSDINEGL